MNTLPSTQGNKDPHATFTIMNNVEAGKIVPSALNPKALESTRAQLGSTYKKPSQKKLKKKAKDQRMYDCWNDVNGMRNACTDLLRTSLAIIPLLREKPLLECVVNKSLLARTISAITRDTETLAKELTVLGNFVDASRAKCRNEGDVLTAAQTAYQHYVNYMERFDSALLPSIEHASEQLTVALIAYAKVQPEAAQKLQYEMNTILTNIGYIVRDTIGATTAKE